MARPARGHPGDGARRGNKGNRDRDAEMTGAETAPLFTDIAEGPAGGRAWWLRARDGVRLRVALWPALSGSAEGTSAGPAGAAGEAGEAGESAGASAGASAPSSDAPPAPSSGPSSAPDPAPPPAPRGTVLLFPGRTEYIEKYGPVARELAGMGLASVAIDWRGQGLSDRACDDPMAGHVRDFAEYQLDVDAMLKLVARLDLPMPLFVLGHSMGGCIALRALHEGLAVAGAVFSAPMWGLSIAPGLRPLAWGASFLLHALGRGCVLAPGTRRTTYVEEQEFEGNTLTTDRESYEFLQRQARAHPELTLGGPSMSWLRAALLETRALARLPAPALPALSFLGTRERIVDPRPVRDLMARWPGGRLEVLEGAEHEILMETPQIRARVWQAFGAFVEAAPAPGRG